MTRRRLLREFVRRQSRALVCRDAFGRALGREHRRATRATNRDAKPQTSVFALGGAAPLPAPHEPGGVVERHVLHRGEVVRQSDPTPWLAGLLRGSLSNAVCPRGGGGGGELQLRAISRAHWRWAPRAGAAAASPVIAPGIHARSASITAEKESAGTSYAARFSAASATRAKKP